MNEDAPPVASSGRPQRLGTLLSEARERAGLGLSDLAQVTHVRRAYLEALEDGRYNDLPEDVFARNFLRLYAQTVGLELEPLVEMYLRERRQAMGLSTLEQRLDRDRRSASNLKTSPTQPVNRGRRWPAWIFGPWLATLGLVVVVVGLALWGFDRFFASRPVTLGQNNPPTQNAPANPAAGQAAEADAAAPGLGGQGAASDALVRIEVITTPPGAEISIDGFPIPGRTPLQDIPVSARGGRLLRAELDGYQTLETTVDLLVDSRVELTLSLLPDGQEEPGPAAAVSQGRLGISVSESSWLEVYASGERNVGARLVYTTAAAGASYEFDLPVFVYVGNAAGVRINLGGQDLGAMGSPGQVTGRAFP